MSTPPIPIDYTSLDYDSMRSAMLALASQVLPEWTDLSENDLGVVLTEMFAYACDITLYYQSRIAANLLPESSDEPQALVQLLRLIGYELSPPTAASGNLVVGLAATVVPPFTIPAATQFLVAVAGGGQLPFETAQDITIQAADLTPPDVAGVRYYSPVPVVQGETVTNNPGAVSDGSARQSLVIQAPAGTSVLPDSIVVTVTEPGGLTRWQQVPSLGSSGPADRNFVVQRDATGSVTLLFGDGINGLLVPRGTATNPVVIKPLYRLGGGPAGNVPANSQFVSLLTTIVSATNPQAAAGGADAEDIDRARFFAPRLYRTQDRAVTLQDFVDLALTIPGVGKARAVSAGWNQVTIFVAPTGSVADPSELLQRDILAFFESRRMATVSITVFGPQVADIYMSATVRAQPYYLQSDVNAAVQQAVSSYLAFDAVDFGQSIYLSKIYDVIQNLPQVASLNVTEFSRTPHPVSGTDRTRSGSNSSVDADGVIALGANELPRPGYRDNPANPANPLDKTYRPAIDIAIVGGVKS
jgi:hypothetical protein